MSTLTPSEPHSQRQTTGGEYDGLWRIDSFGMIAFFADEKAYRPEERVGIDIDEPNIPQS